MSGAQASARLCAFEVWCVLFPEHCGFSEVVNARTRGQAKHYRHRSIVDAWPGVPYTSMRARVVGPPRSSDDFVRCATYRGHPSVRCGDFVEFGNSRGCIVGHNSSANWDVLVEAGDWSGQVVNVHPATCTYPERRL